MTERMCSYQSMLLVPSQLDRTWRFNELENRKDLLKEF